MTKRIICYGLIFLFLTNVSFAKDRWSIELSLKPQTITCIGNNEFLNSETIKRKADLKLEYGLDINIQLLEKFSIGMGAYYNPQGIKEETIKIGNREEDYFFHADMKYLRIPLNFKYKLWHTKDYNIIFSIGAAYNHLLDANDDLRLTIGFIGTPISDPDERYNKYVIDAGMSLEFDYKILDRFYLISKVEGITGLTRFHAPYIEASNGRVDINSRLLSVGISIGFGYFF